MTICSPEQRAAADSTEAAVTTFEGRMIHLNYSEMAIEGLKQKIAENTRDRIPDSDLPLFPSKETFHELPTILAKGSFNCPNCKKPLGNCLGESSIYGSSDVGDLCEPCWLEEDELIDQEGTNDPSYSEAINARLQRYRE